MKKFISILLVLSLLALTACGNGNIEQTTGLTETTVDPVTAKAQEKQVYNKINLRAYFSGLYMYPDTAIIENPDDGEHFWRLMEKFVDFYELYDPLYDIPGFVICIEWTVWNEEDEDLIAYIESRIPVKGVNESRRGVMQFACYKENWNRSLSEYCEELPEILYNIAKNDSVDRVILSNACVHFPVPF